MTMKRQGRLGLLVLLMMTCVACVTDPVTEISITPTQQTWIVGERHSLDLTSITVTLTNQSLKTHQLPITALSNGRDIFTLSHTIDFTTPGTYPVIVTHISGIQTQFEVVILPVPYTDNNPVVVGLYGANRSLITASVGLFVKNVDIGVYSVFYSQESPLPRGYYQTVFPQLAEQYELQKPVKIGYELQFSLKDGSLIRQRVTAPLDEKSTFWTYVRVYLYDDVHVPINTWYSHLLPSQMTETTLMTSIKLTGNTQTHQIEGSIQLRVFTYDGEDDFDPLTGFYRGNSSYTIQINPKTP